MDSGGLNVEGQVLLLQAVSCNIDNNNNNNTAKGLFMGNINSDSYLGNAIDININSNSNNFNFVHFGRENEKMPIFSISSDGSLVSSGGFNNNYNNHKKILL